MKSRFKPTFLMALALLVLNAQQASAKITYINNTSSSNGGSGASTTVNSVTGNVSGDVRSKNEGQCAPEDYKGNTIAPNFLQDAFMAGEKLGIYIDNAKSTINIKIPQYVTGCMELASEVRVQNNDHIVRLKNNKKEYSAAELFNSKKIKELAIKLVGGENPSDEDVESKIAEVKAMTWDDFKKLESPYNSEKKIEELTGQEMAEACLLSKGQAKKEENGNYSIDMSKLAGSISSGHNDLVLNVSDEYDRNKTSRLLFAQFNDDRNEYTAGKAKTIPSVNYHDNEKEDWKCHKASPLADNNSDMFIHESEIDKVLSAGCAANNPYDAFTELGKLINLVSGGHVAGNYTAVMGDMKKILKREVFEQLVALEKEKNEIELEIENKLNEFDPEDMDDADIRAFYTEYKDLVKKMDEKVIGPSLKTVRALLELRTDLPRDSEQHEWVQDSIDTLQGDYVSSIADLIKWKSTSSRGDETYRDLEEFGMRSVARELHGIESKSRFLSQVCTKSSCKKVESIDKQFAKAEKLAGNERRYLDTEIRTTWKEIRDSKKGRDTAITRGERELERKHGRYNSSRKSMVKGYNKKYNKAKKKACNGWNKQQSCQKFHSYTGPRLQRKYQGKVDGFDRRFQAYSIGKSEHLSRLGINVEQYREANNKDEFSYLGGYDEYSYFRDINSYDPYRNNGGFGSYDYTLGNNPAAYTSHQQPQFRQPAQQQFSPVNNQIMFGR